MFTNILSLSKAGIRVKAAVLTFNYLRYISIEASPLSLKSTFCMTDSGWQVQISHWLSACSAFCPHLECLRPSIQPGFRMVHSLPVVPRAYAAVRPG